MIVNKYNSYYFGGKPKIIKYANVKTCASSISRFVIRSLVQNSYFHDWEIEDLISEFEQSLSIEMHNLRLSIENDEL